MQKLALLCLFAILITSPLLAIATDNGKPSDHLIVGKWQIKEAYFKAETSMIAAFSSKKQKEKYERNLKQYRGAIITFHPDYTVEFVSPIDNQIYTGKWSLEDIVARSSSLAGTYVGESIVIKLDDAGARYNFDFASNINKKKPDEFKTSHKPENHLIFQRLNN